MPTPSRTSLEAIVSAAREILENDGLDGLTMQRVGQAVGVRAPSLYKHVHSRTDLIRLVIEDAGREAGDAIGRNLHAVAAAFRAYAHGHPQAYNLLFGPVPEAWRPDPTAMASANAAVLGIGASLVGSERALEAARLIVAWAHGFVSMELAGAFRLGGDVDDAFEYAVERIADALSAARPS